MRKLVVLSGAGISAESGIPTFRDAGGLWEGYPVSEVATPEAWQRNPSLVQEFYNHRRKKALEVSPNQGHLILAALEEYFDTTIITQNIDNLHERAGSTKVIHLHGSIFESRSSVDSALIYPISGWELKMGELCEKGSQLRPNIVWFGEEVPMITVAGEYCAQADFFIIVGTSLVVYPAAGLIHFVPHDAVKFTVDPGLSLSDTHNDVIHFAEKASTGLQRVRDQLMNLL